VLSRSSPLVGFAVLWAGLVATGCADGPAPSGEVKVAVVKHKQVLEALGKQRGKIVVIDVWGEF
jgi:hypothetical protein